MRIFFVLILTFISFCYGKPYENEDKSIMLDVLEIFKFRQPDAQKNTVMMGVDGPPPRE